MAAIFQVRRGDSSNTSSLVNGELYLNNAENAFQVGTNGNPIKLLSLNTASFGDIILTGSAYISGNVVLGGTITIGDSTSDSVVFNADLSSSIIPDSGSTYDLGSNSKWYKNLYVNTISASFISGAIAGIGNLEVFSQSVDSRLDYLEGPFSTSVDSRMDLLETAMSGSNRLYVSPSGSDSNTGTQQNPFRTIKAAVESLGSAVFTNTNRTTIFVGSGNYTEQNPITLPPGVAIVGDNLRTVRLTAANPTKDYFHCHDGNYFYGLRFLNLQNPSFAFSYPCSTATSTISGGGVSTISVVHSMTGYTDGNNQDLGIIIEGPDVSGSIATATANVSSGVITQINVVSGGTNYVNGEKPHISIPAPLSKRPIIGTSPYIQNCSSITGPFTTDGTLLSLVPGTANYAELPYNINDVRNESNILIGSGVIDEQGAGGGIRIDGNLVHPSSPLESFVADAFTQVNQGGPGHLVINKGYAQFVSCFTTFCTYGFKTAAGGFANISNSVIDFGKYGLVSKTYFPQTYNTGSSLETKTSTVSGFIIDENGAGYTGSVASVSITGGGASVQATAQANVNANGSIDEIVLLTGGSGYTTQPSVTIAPPTGAGAIQATTVAGKALITGVTEILMSLQSGSRGIDISSNMILNGIDYLVTDVAAVSGQANQRRVTTYPAPPSITTGNNVYFHQLSNISTGGLVMEYGGSGVTYNALPKFGGVPIRTREINEFAPGRVFYSTVDNIGNLKIGDFFAVNQLTGEVTIDANSFNLSGLNAIGPFKRNGAAVGVVLQEVSNNTTLLNSQGLFGEDTVPTQYAVKEYIYPISASLDSRLDNLQLFTASISGINEFTSSTKIRLTNLESKSASVDTSLTELNAYTSSLKQAITASGADITINGNLTVKGTTTQIDSTTLNIGDNIIQLNGSSVTNAGLQVKDPTAASTLSGSLLWDSTLDYWKAGTLTNESKILLAGGDSVISSSLQLPDLNSFTQSANIRLGLLETSTGSLNIFSSSTLTRLGLLETSTGSLNTATASLYTSASLMTASIASLTASVVALQSFSGNVNTRFDNLQTYTTSVDGRLTNLESKSASVDISITNINTFSGSTLGRLTNLESKSASVDISIANINTFTGSQLTQNSTLATYTGSINDKFVAVQSSTASLNLFTASAYVSFSLMTASIDAHQYDIDYIKTNLGLGGTNPIIPLQQWSASINTFTASVNSRLSNIETATSSYETNGRGIVSGSSQITPLLPTGVISGSSQILGGTGIVSGSSQITPLLPAGVVSGSSQTIANLPTGTISGSSQVLGGSTIHSSSIGNYQFNSIGVGAVASTGVAGEIVASGDITAFSTSDIRLKENIISIPNALEKVNQISGNTYDWKAGYDEIHSHKGNDVGVIAQEIEAVLPQIVTNRDNGYKAVQYEKIIPLLVEAIKELSAKIDRLENK